MQKVLPQHAALQFWFCMTEADGLIAHKGQGVAFPCLPPPKMFLGPSRILDFSSSAIRDRIVAIPWVSNLSIDHTQFNSVICMKDAIELKINEMTESAAVVQFYQASGSHHQRHSASATPVQLHCKVQSCRRQYAGDILMPKMAGDSDNQDGTRELNHLYIGYAGGSMFSDAATYNTAGRSVATISRAIFLHNRRSELKRLRIRPYNRSLQAKESTCTFGKLNFWQEETHFIMIIDEGCSSVAALEFRYCDGSTTSDNL